MQGYLRLFQVYNSLSRLGEVLAQTHHLQDTVLLAPMVTPNGYC